MMRPLRKIVPVFAVVYALSAQPAPPAAQSPAPLFRAGTRLVEVDVVVSGKQGPVTGLTRDDFTLLDQGKARPIAVFSGAAAAQPVDVPAFAPLPPGAVSNRISPSGRRIPGATVLLFDQLNTSFDNQGYARGQLLHFLESAESGEQIAIYLLGRNLTVVQDFTGDRELLTEAVRHWNPKNALLLIQSTENMDATDLQMESTSSPTYARIRALITSQAIQSIVQHLSGMPGRKNLIWLSDSPTAPASQFLNAAGIHLYPVLVRGVGSSGVFAWMRNTRAAGGFAPAPLPLGNDLARQHAVAAVAALSGGAGFADSRDIALAVDTALQDAAHTYTLGFYPDESAFDNKVHTLTVKLGRKAAALSALQIRYRPGYFASRAGGPVPAPTPVDSVLRNPLDASSIGITAAPGFAAGKYQVTLTVDLHDVHFEAQNQRHQATLGVSVADDGTQAVQTETFHLSFTDSEFAAALARGLVLTKILEKEAAVRIVARDQATGLSGSLRVLPPEHPAGEK